MFNVAEIFQRPCDITSRYSLTLFAPSALSGPKGLLISPPFVPRALFAYIRDRGLRNDRGAGSEQPSGFWTLSSARVTQRGENEPKIICLAIGLACSAIPDYLEWFNGLN